MWDVLKEYPAARVRLESIAVKRLEKYKKAPLEKGKALVLFAATPLRYPSPAEPPNSTTQPATQHPAKPPESPPKQIPLEIQRYPYEYEYDCPRITRFDCFRLPFRLSFLFVIDFICVRFRL